MFKSPSQPATRRLSVAAAIGRDVPRRELHDAFRGAAGGGPKSFAVAQKLRANSKSSEMTSYEYPGEEDLLEYEHMTIFNMADEAAAAKFVDSVVPLMSIKDLKEAAALVLGVSGKRLQVRRSRRRVRGGTRADARFCRMLAALDSVHDFRSGQRPGLPVDTILGFAGLALDDFDPVLRKAMTTDLASFEAALAEAVSAPDSFTFMGEVVPNLLKGCNLVASSAFSKLSQMNAGWRKYYAMVQSRADARRQLPVEIWTAPLAGDSRKPVILLNQLLAFEHTLKEFFGSVTDVMFDTTGFGEDMIIKLCTASSLVTDRLLLRFELRDFDVLPGDRAVMLRLCDKVARYRDLFKDREPLIAKTCDANRYDAGLEDTDVFGHVVRDPEPTGEVLHCPGITLCGLTDEGHVRLVVDGQRLTLGPECASYVSSKKKVADRLGNAEERRPEMPENYEVLTERDAGAMQLELFLRSVPREVQLSLKRAGDWAQVQHCRRTGAVFVTRDRLAAMYAYATGTACVLYRNMWSIEDDFSKHIFTFTRAVSRA